MAILRSPAAVPRSAAVLGSVLSLVMLLHHLSVLRHLHLAPDEHQHEQDQCRGLLELGAEHAARVLLDDAEAEPGDDAARNVAEAGGGAADHGADRMHRGVTMLKTPHHPDQLPGSPPRSPK